MTATSATNGLVKSVGGSAAAVLGDTASTVRVDERFCGPPGTGNGGYVSGLLAERLSGPGGRRAVEVTLRLPTPVGTPLVARGEPDGSLQLVGDGDVLAVARAVPALAAPEWATGAAPDFARARAASARASDEHPFPHCFVCGPARRPGDGLRIHVGPLETDARGRTRMAAPWVPDPSLADATGRVRSRFLWAALDCPGGIAALAGRACPILLARMAAEMRGPVAIGERCVLTAWPIEREGRKHTMGTALYGEDGTLRGHSRQLWIEPRPR